jgi:hypothetical protein
MEEVTVIQSSLLFYLFVCNCWYNNSTWYRDFLSMIKKKKILNLNMLLSTPNYAGIR